LTVSYYGNDGKPIHNERHTPIATPLQFTDFNLPIVPFAPGQTRDFGVTLKAPPEVAQDGQPRAAVSGIIFSEFDQPLAAPPKFAGSSLERTGQTTAHGEPKPSATAPPASAPSSAPTPKPGHSSVRQTEGNTAPEGGAAKTHKKRSRHRERSTPP
jgi:hypothetical protein